MIIGHGDDAYQYRVPIRANFSSNVFTGIDNVALRRHLADFLKTDCIGTYPEPQPFSLERELARRLHIDEEEVCATSGATSAIYLLAQSFPNVASAILQPTFSEYADACLMAGHRVLAKYALTEAEHTLRQDDEIRLMWICNPNNPTGNVLDKGWLSKVIDANPDVIFVIDQSYEDFTLKELFSAKEAARDFKNVILLHSMTKHYAIPGMRLGYMTGPHDLMVHLRSRRMPWAISSLALEAGKYLLQHGEYAEIDLTKLLRETQWLKEELEATGALDVWQTDTHFMLIRMRYGKAAALKDWLANEHGILIRDASNFEGLDDHYFRIATQTHEANLQLIDAIKEWIEY